MGKRKRSSSNPENRRRTERREQTPENLNLSQAGIEGVVDLLLRAAAFTASGGVSDSFSVPGEVTQGQIPATEVTTSQFPQIRPTPEFETEALRMATTEPVTTAALFTSPVSAATPHPPAFSETRTPAVEVMTIIPRPSFLSAVVRPRSTPFTETDARDIVTIKPEITAAIFTSPVSATTPQHSAFNRTTIMLPPFSSSAVVRSGSPAVSMTRPAMLSSFPTTSGSGVAMSWPLAASSAQTVIQANARGQSFPATEAGVSCQCEAEFIKLRKEIRQQKNFTHQVVQYVSTCFNNNKKETEKLKVKLETLMPKSKRDEENNEEQK